MSDDEERSGVLRNRHGHSGYDDDDSETFQYSTLFFFSCTAFMADISIDIFLVLAEGPILLPCKFIDSFDSRFLK